MKNYSIAKYFYFIGIFIFSSDALLAQNCEQKLKLANKYYQEGKIELIKELLKPCLDQKRLDKKQILEAYRLISNAFYLMDSLNQGVHFVSSILNRDLTYKGSPGDSYSFKNGLFDISQRPHFQFGLDIGVNIPHVHIDDIFNDVFDMNTAQSIGGIKVDNLISDVKSEFGLSMKWIFIRQIRTRLDLESGIGFHNINYNYTDNYKAEKAYISITDWQVPIMVNYRLPLLLDGNTINIQLGTVLRFLNNWDQRQASGSMLSLDAIRTQFNYDLTLGAFLNIKTEYLIVRPRFQYSMGLSSRAQKLSLDQNIKYLYNSPSFVNYNNHFNHFIFSVALLKPKFR
tara:strand:- start:9238 stop:10263 length:1026 start_codon:yes stop_codon:yes gene_type:complete